MKYTYDAFISYRHTELDKFVAENLHRQLEAFKLPRSISKGKDLPRRKIERVFRDKDELPLASNLEDPIVEALQNSEFLIVICSPRLKESVWCLKEIETFIELHGRSKILAVLIEGEPEDSFPQQLLYDESGKMVEPLAADVRGQNRSDVKKAMKSELLRLLAPMFGLGYDDLKQRHRERRMKKIAALVGLCGAVGVAFGVVCATAAFRINGQKVIIEQQNTKLEDQNVILEEQNITLGEQKNILAVSAAESLSREALELYASDSRKDAIALAYEAMTEHDGIEMPQTAYSEYVLATCLNVYDGAFYASCEEYITMPGVITDMKVSPSGTVILASDNIGNLIAFDSETNEKLFEIKDDTNIDAFDFIDDNRFYYFNYEGGLRSFNISDNALTTDETTALSTFAIKPVPDKNLIAVTTFEGLSLRDADTLELVSEVSCREHGTFDKIYISSNGDIFLLGHNSEWNYKCVVISPEQAQIKKVVELSGDFVHDACMTDGIFYIISAGGGTDAGTSLAAIETGSCDLIYEKRIDGFEALDIAYTQEGDAQRLLLSCAGQSILVDAKSGQELEEYFFTHNMVKDITGGEGNFCFYTEDGFVRVISITEPYDEVAYLALMAEDVVQFESTSSTVIARRENDNRILVYAYIFNNDACEYTGEKAEPVAKSPYSEDARKWAVENNIPSASFVDGYVEADGVYYVRYINDTAKAFDAVTLEELAAYDDITSSRMNYYGKIGNYNIVEMGSVALLLDEERNVCARIGSFMGITADKTAVIVSGRNADKKLADMAIPVYSREQLLEKAKEYIGLE